MSDLELQDVVGQDEAIERLQRAMHADRLPHAFLFAGPAGVGRRTTTVAFAKTLLCSKPVRKPAAKTDKKPPFRQACGQCEDCRMMAVEAHPDFHLVYKELARYHDDANVRARVMQEVSIAVIRSFLIAPAGRAASRGRGKVFVVLEAELMSIAAQNALLKTLEEPPDGVTIILICQNGEQLLPTTLSRCWMVRFGPLPEKFVTGRLLEAGVDEGEASFWAAFTEGSLGRALRLTRQGMYEVKRNVIERLAKLTPAGDAELAEHIAKVTDRLAAQAVAAAGKETGAELSKMLATRRVVGNMLELIAGAFRDALSLATGAERSLTNADQHKAIEALANRFEPLKLTEILEALNRYEQLLWRNVNPKILWDNVVITCASAAPLRV